MMKKILFFIESLRAGGKERRLVELIKFISKDKSYLCALVILKNEIHYKEIYNYDIKIHLIERKYLRKDPRVFFLFYRVCREFLPDIIHAWGNMPAFYAIPTKYILKIPLINSQITNAPLSVRSGIISHKINFLFSNHIVANSYAGLEAYKAPKFKSSVIYNAFDFERIESLKNPDIIKNMFHITAEKLVGMVASFSEKKDYTTFIGAANIVLSQYLNVSFLCIGSGDNSIYRNLIHANNREKIRLMSEVANIESIINCFSIGVLSTYTEGISNSIMEYMALRKPVVATNGGGTNELVEDNKTGFLVLPKDTQMLAEKILLLLRDPAKAEEMGINGQKRIVKKFNMRHSINAYKTLYNKYS